MKVTIILAAILILIVGGANVFVRSPRFGRLPRGERQAKIERLPNFRDGIIANLSPTPQLTSKKGFMTLLFEKRENTRPTAPLPIQRPDLWGLDRVHDMMVWFGHSSVFLQLDGRRVMIDPVFCAAAPVWFVNRPFEGTDVFKPADIPDLDYLLITHDHWDHLDYQTVMQLKERVGKVICPLGVGEHFERWGFAAEQIIELAWGENSAQEGGVELFCLPARHFSGRLKTRKTLWASFWLRTPTHNIYIGGDGGYDTHFAQIGERFGAPDLAILECGQYNENWRFMHMAPEQTIAAARDLRAKKVVAVHNSKFALARHTWQDPLERAAAAAQKEGVELLTPMIGQMVELKNADQKFEKWWRLPLFDA